MAWHITNFLHAQILHQSEGKFCGRSEFLVAEISVAGSFKLLLSVVYSLRIYLGFSELISGYFCIFLSLYSLWWFQWWFWN